MAKNLSIESITRLVKFAVLSLAILYGIESWAASPAKADCANNECRTVLYQDGTVQYCTPVGSSAENSCIGRQNSFGQFYCFTDTCFYEFQ